MSEFIRPAVDWHAIAPELTLLAGFVVVLLGDLLFDERRWAPSSLAGIAFLAPLVPIATLFADGDSLPRAALGDVPYAGVYVVDEFSLVLKALFCIAGYVTVLLATNYIAEGDYHEPEFYELLVASTLGMLVMSSARDLVTIFVAFELLSIPTYLLAAWRKQDLRSNEAGLKYYLMGVFASAVMLFGMSLVYGATGTTVLADVGRFLAGDTTVNLGGEALDLRTAVVVGILFTLVGFAFKVSAVPFHTWAPDTYEGAPTPVTAYLSVASKAAGFVAMLQLVVVGFLGQSEVWRPYLGILAVATMTVGNLIALRQTNVIRLLAYSSVAQAGFMLVPFAVMGSPEVTSQAVSAVVIYLVIYAAMNLGAFALVMAVARKTRSAEIDDFAGLYTYAPGMAVLTAVFFFALAGIPPLGGWFAKFVVFGSLLAEGGAWAVFLGVITAVNSVIALFYYANVARVAWSGEPPYGDRSPIRVPVSIGVALTVTAAATLAFGVLPQLAARWGELAELVTAAAP